MKKLIGIILGSLIIIFGIYFLFFHKTTDKIEVGAVEPKIEKKMTIDEKTFLPEQVFQTKETLDRREDLEFFIDARLMDEKGIATNYLPNSELDGELATGEERLSESSGLYLRHLQLVDTQGRFDSFYKQTKQLFYDKVQFSYRIDQNGKKYAVNASIDDLRIIRALIGAKARYQTDTYDKEIDQLAKNFMATSMNDYILVDFYDVENEQKSQETSLFYVDFTTMGYLFKKYDVSSDYLQYHYELINNGYLSDEFPFYQTRYNHKKKAYENNGTINIIESLLTILHLSETGLQKPESIDFIKNRVSKGTLFNSYDLNGNPVDKNQSAASYAITALIGVEIQDKDLYNASIRALNGFQITDSNSQLFGGFGEVRTQEVFSFNNLMALLAYDY